MGKNKKLEDGGYYAIKGFLYQYDATLLKVMKLPSADDCVEIENIQDFSANDEIYQLKYKEAQNYSSSKIRKAVKQLLDISKYDKKSKYILKVHFKNRKEGQKVLTTQEIKKILGKEARDYSDVEITRFCNKFTLIWGEDYQAQITNVLKAIFKYSKTKEKALLWHSWMSRYLLEKVAQNKSKKDRICSRKELLNSISESDQKYFDVAYKEYLGKKKYFAYVKKEIFSPKINTNAKKRLFILEPICGESESVISSVLQTISGKYVKKTSNNLVGDAPYVLIKNISAGLLIRVKEWFYDKRIQFVDGYPFQGACFKKEILSRNFKDEKEGLRLRVINTEKDLELIKDRFWDEIYDFSLTGTRTSLSAVTRIYIDHIKEINQIL